MISKAAKKHSRQNSMTKISLLSSEDVFNVPLPMRISNTIAGSIPETEMFTVEDQPLTIIDQTSNEHLPQQVHNQAHTRSV